MWRKRPWDAPQNSLYTTTISRTHVHYFRPHRLIPPCFISRHDSCTVTTRRAHVHHARLISPGEAVHLPKMQLKNCTCKAEPRPRPPATSGCLSWPTDSCNQRRRSGQQSEDSSWRVSYDTRHWAWPQGPEKQEQGSEEELLSRSIRAHHLRPELRSSHPREVRAVSHGISPPGLLEDSSLQQPCVERVQGRRFHSQDRGHGSGT